MKRMVVIADTHCGHQYGLTPPGWWRSDQGLNEKGEKILRFQKNLWNFYQSKIESLKPIDLLVFNGDAIEGKGVRSGGIELLTSDRNEQVRMARDIINVAEAREVTILYGTRAHVGVEEDFENILKDIIDCKNCEIEGHSWIDIGGVIVDIKHKLSGGGVPHTRATPLMRAWLWNAIWAEAGRQPKAQLFLRSHVHFFLGVVSDEFTAFSTPALSYNSSFGIRECEGLVHVGFMSFDFHGEGDYSWMHHKAPFKDMKVEARSILE